MAPVDGITGPLAYSRGSESDLGIPLGTSDVFRRERYLKTGRDKRYLRKRLAVWLKAVTPKQLERLEAARYKFFSNPPKALAITCRK
jgi:hypothetical protein